MASLTSMCGTSLSSSSHTVKGKLPTPSVSRRPTIVLNLDSGFISISGFAMRFFCRGAPRPEFMLVHQHADKIVERAGRATQIAGAQEFDDQAVENRGAQGRLVGAAAGR